MMPKGHCGQLVSCGPGLANKSDTHVQLASTPGCCAFACVCWYWCCQSWCTTCCWRCCSCLLVLLRKTAAVAAHTRTW